MLSKDWFKSIQCFQKTDLRVFNAFKRLIQEYPMLSKDWFKSIQCFQGTDLRVFNAFKDWFKSIQCFQGTDLRVSYALRTAFKSILFLKDLIVSFKNNKTVFKNILLTKYFKNNIIF